jgi:hypothetical protein
MVVGRGVEESTAARNAHIHNREARCVAAVGNINKSNSMELNLDLKFIKQWFVYSFVPYLFNGP